MAYETTSKLQPDNVTITQVVSGHVPAHPDALMLPTFAADAAVHVCG
jgi:hypothetical protein